MKKNVLVVSVLLLTLLAAFFWADGARPALADNAYAEKGPSPLKFSKLTPKDGSYDLDRPITLKWMKVTGAQYEYCVATNPTACASDYKNATTNSVTLNNLEERTGYYWQVRATVNGEVYYANGSADAYWIFGTEGTMEP